MGPLTIPRGASVYFDAQIAIYSVERHAVYEPLLLDFWRRVQAFEIISLTSDLSLHECLVHPLRHADPVRVRSFEDFFVRPNVQTCMVTSTVLGRAAQLRADHPRLRTPDAIHIATAMEWQAAFFLTNDKAFRGLASPRVLVLDELVSPPPIP